MSEELKILAGVVVVFMALPVVLSLFAKWVSFVAFVVGGILG